MSYNPYAAPQAPYGAPAPYTPGGPQPWNASSLLNEAWPRFTKNWPALVGSLLVAWLVSALAYVALLPFMFPLFALNLSTTELSARIMNDLRWPIRGVGLGSIFVATYFRVGLLRIWTKVARGEQASIGDLFAVGDRYLPLLLLNLLLFIPYQGAALMLGAPSFLIWLFTWSSELFVVDANMSPIDALKAHVRVMGNQWGQVALFGLLGGVLSIFGSLACCVGLFVAIPVYEVARSMLYLRVSGQGAPALPVQGGPPVQPPPAGYGGWPQNPG